MHLLGLNGMARRVPDYPDQYSTIHFICSVGAFCSYLSLLYFFYIIYIASVIDIKFLEKRLMNKNTLNLVILILTLTTELVVM